MSVSPRENGILNLDREHLREIDGVVFDLDSYERHCSAAPSNQDPSPAVDHPAPAAAPAPSMDHDAPATPTGVFFCEPVHAGWYEPASAQEVRYPIMAGAIAPNPERPICLVQYSGSFGSWSSFSSSFHLRYTTSFMTSWLMGSGRWVTSWRMQSSFLSSFSSEPFSDNALTCLAGGYGLELI